MSEHTLNLSPALQAHRERDVETCLKEVTPILKNTPHHPVALHLKAWAISKKGQNEKALEILSEVVENNPKLVPARAEYGNLLMANRRHAEALNELREAHQLQPERDELALKYYICLIKNQEFVEAERGLRQILEKTPHHFQARYALSTALLNQGKWKEGFDQYQIRFWLGDINENPIGGDWIEWKGEEIEGKTILIKTENRYADQILFIRYANWLKETYQPGKVIVEADPEMKTLFESVEGIDQVVCDAESVEFDRYVPLLNLPYYHGTEPESIPEASEGYLSIPEETAEKWKNRLSEESPKIAVCWRSNLIGGDEADTEEAGEKSVNSLNRKQAEHLCQQLRGMFQDAEILSLQPAVNKKDRAMLNRNKITNISNHPIEDFADTAAIVDQMDLVVSIDTAIAHIAGALGKPVWNLLPYTSDWRWSQDEEYSNWYPNMRLFRQSSEDDWMSLDCPDLLAELAQAA